MSGSVGGIGVPVPRNGVSLSNACSLVVSPNSLAAAAACGLVSLCWPRIAPVTRIGDMPPISPQIYFQVQPLSRLMSSSFSVRPSRVMANSCPVAEFDNANFKQILRHVLRAGYRLSVQGPGREPSRGTHAQRTLHLPQRHGRAACGDARLAARQADGLR